MSGSVTYCLNCGKFEWAGKDKCSTCGGELAPTLREVHAQIMADKAKREKQHYGKR